MSLFEALATVIALLTVLRGLLLRRWSRRLRPVPACEDPADEDLPSLSLVVAARNEERHLEDAVRSWLALELPRLQVVVVDDRSTDRTPEILGSIAAEHSELVCVRVDERPVDWLGKCWALQQGADRATGQWLLFTDADVVFDRRALRRVLAHAQAEAIDHLALLPSVRAEGVVQRAFTWLFFQVFLTLLGGRKGDGSSGRGAIGVGAFGLVRRSAYLEVGGHEEIRLQVGDDIALARLLVRAGLSSRAHWGLDVAELEWQPGLWATVKGLEKNAFWAMRFSPAVLLLATAGSLLHLLPLFAPLAGSLAGWAAFACWWAGVGLAYRFPAAGRLDRAAAILLHPLSVLLLVATSWNSALSTWRHGGIRWREDLIPLETLRAAQKPLRWWTERISPRNRVPPKT